jgi:hypothetical protein
MNTSGPAKLSRRTITVAAGRGVSSITSETIARRSICFSQRRGQDAGRHQRHRGLAAARSGVGSEIGPEQLARDAITAGCLFALDSDAHSTSELRYADTAIAHARLAGVPAERVINCWPLDQLLDWTAERKFQSVKSEV